MVKYPSATTPRHRLRAAVTAVTLLGAVSTFVAGSPGLAWSAPQSQSQPQLLALSQAEAALPAGTVGDPSALPGQIEVSVALKPRDPAGADKFASDVSNPASPLYHHFLSSFEYTERFGPTRQSVDAVASYLAGKGLKVLSVSGNRQVVTAVIYPKYQASLVTLPSSYTSNATSSTKTALSWLGANASPAPDLSAGMVLASHSYGGPISVNMANEYAKSGLPTPKALMLAEPYNQSVDSSLSGIPANTQIDCLVGNNDTNVGRTGCDVIWGLTSQVTNRDYVWMYSDNHGIPGLTANHYAPTTSGTGTTDALDFYGTWKLTDGLRDCSLYGTDCGYALGGGSQQTFMGTWSDGVPVAPLTVTTTPPACPTGSISLGC